MTHGSSRGPHEGHHAGGGNVAPASLTLDPLLSWSTISDFECDITDVAGIMGSKSSALDFANIEAFGHYFLDFKSAPFNADGLARMLAHHEVRVVRDSGSDSFALDLWDGRLFLCNDGGSHHFAAAAVIARTAGLPVRLKRPLSMRRLNERAWLDLIERFEVLSVVDKGRCWSCLDVAAAAGSSFWVRLPPAVSPADLFLVPRDAPACGDVVELLCTAGAVEAEAGIRALLAAQREVESNMLPSLRSEAPDL